MANKYKFDDIYIEDLMKEEDREVYNDCLRAKTLYYEQMQGVARSQNAYYDIQAKINSRILSILNRMTDDEIKDILKNNGLKIPTE